MDQVSESKRMGHLVEECPPDIIPVNGIFFSNQDQIPARDAPSVPTGIGKELDAIPRNPTVEKISVQLREQTRKLLVENDDGGHTKVLVGRSRNRG